jgi:hypothetical protein
MSGSYYEAHYARERRQAPQWFLEKLYLENRPKYEVAFVAAFKAMERLFQKAGFRDVELGNIFARLPYPSIRSNTVYTRKHEVFSRQKEKISYEDMAAHFLRLRNTVAAHGNRKPPERISEDSIFEIQRFVSELFFRAIGDNFRKQTQSGKNMALSFNVAPRRR